MEAWLFLTTEGEKHNVYKVFVCDFSGRYFPVFSPYGKYGKIRTGKIPNTNSFHAKEGIKITQIFHKNVEQLKVIWLCR